jgi:D-alanine--poly(phosphoribitol) ligase subunit 1
MSLILRKILETFKKHPDKLAYQVGNSTYTYKEFEQRINTIINYISSDKVKDQFYFGVEASEVASFETYCQIFACIFAGKCFVPTNLNYPKERIEFLLANTGIKTVLTHSESAKFESDFLELNNVQLVNTQLFSTDLVSELGYKDYPEENHAYILFTSGSTGFPKGVPITRGNLFAFAEAFLSFGYKVDETDRFIQMFDYTFDLSIFCCFMPALYGASVHPVASKGIKLSNTFNVLLDNNITYALLVPAFLSFLKPYYEEIKLPHLRHLLFAGEAMPNELTYQFSDCVPNARILNFYGPTEATIFCTGYEWKEELRAYKHHNGGVTIGKVFPNLFGIILNEKNELTKTKELGELCIAGNQLTPGYFNNDEKNKESFISFELQGKLLRFYRTGDLTYYDQDGDIMYAGRKDYQVKIQGFRVELGEIEYNIRKIVKHDEAVVIALVNLNSNTELHVFIVGSDEQVKLIRHELPDHLPTYMLPSNYHIVESLPLNSSGKIDRVKLKELIQ